VNRQHHTAWLNWGATAALLDDGGIGSVPYSQHALAYVLEELRTTGTVNTQGHLLLPTRWRTEDFRTLLNRYCAKYKRCPGCRGFATGLVKVGRVLKLRCSRCTTDSVIDG
jgi:translation initiation factor 2 beta subunit (eIF-2beta)/eIF-5